MRSVIAVLALVLAGPAGAATPFPDGDDGGFIPPDKATAKCEDGYVKGLAKLLAALGTCHLKSAAAQIKHKTFDEDGCETVAEGKFTAAVAKLKACPTCLPAPELVDFEAEFAVDGNNGTIACAPGDAFADEDDTGFVPPDKPTQKCEAAVGKNVLKIFGAYLTCHVKAADAGLKGKVFDEAGCETNATTRYDTANAKVKGCPACLDTIGIRQDARVMFDGFVNEVFYCASPSGAFLDR